MTENPYPNNDDQDFTDADRGFLAAPATGVVRNDKGDIVWDNDAYGFLSGEPADTVHPSLWRQSRLVSKQGLYEVTDGIYQVRGFDLSNMTLVEGATGVIVIDPLISVETADAALALYRSNRGDRPVTGVIYTHSHVDHFGGVKGVVSEQDVASGRVPVIAPEGFMEHAIAENVYAGTAMARRAGYMYGAMLPRDPGGGVGAGLGQTTSTGTVSLIPPTTEISRTGQTLTVDGVPMEFQMAPGSEAPSEMHFYFPDARALCIAENATHTLHNILTLRGALVRDPHAWARYLTEAIELFGDRTDVVFASHHWPTWGTDRVRAFLGDQRDLYAYIHDQTLRLLNKGYTGIEIAELLKLPPALELQWSTHGYYGSVSHNVKAVYQRYMGWYDGNPARLWQLPPVEAATRYVELMGGAETVMRKAEEARNGGELRWAAQILDHVVFADPTDKKARGLLADVLEELGFGSENGTWRNNYLSGAMELRQGGFGTPTVPSSPDMIAQLPPEMFFDALAVQIDGPAAWDLDQVFRWIFPDHDAEYRVSLRNGVLTYVRDGAGDVAATVTVPRSALGALMARGVEAAEGDGLSIDGDRSAIAEFMRVLDPGDPDFAIIEP